MQWSLCELSHSFAVPGRAGRRAQTVAQTDSLHQPNKDTGTYTAVPFPILMLPLLTLKEEGDCAKLRCALQGKWKHHAEIK